MSEPSVDRGWRLADSGRYGKALAEVSSHLASAPDDGEAWSLASYCHAGQGDGEAAVNAGQKAIRLEPESPAAHAVTGFALLNVVGDPRAALLAFDEALRLDPHSADVQYSRARALLQLGRLEAARMQVDAVLNGAPTWAEAHHLRGLILSEIEEKKEARASNRRALELKPDFALAHATEARFEALGLRYRHSAASLNRAITAAPQDSHIRTQVESLPAQLAVIVWMAGVGMIVVGHVSLYIAIPTPIRLVAGVLLLASILALGLLPLRGLSEGARRHLRRAYRPDRFVALGAIVLLVTFAVALTLILAPASVEAHKPSGWRVAQSLVFINLLIRALAEKMKRRTAKERCRYERSGPDPSAPAR